MHHTVPDKHYMIRNNVGMLLYMIPPHLTTPPSAHDPSLLMIHAEKSNLLFSTFPAFPPAFLRSPLRVPVEPG